MKSLLGTTVLLNTDPIRRRVQEIGSQKEAAAALEISTRTLRGYATGNAGDCSTDRTRNGRVKTVWEYYVLRVRSESTLETLSKMAQEPWRIGWGALLRTVSETQLRRIEASTKPQRERRIVQRTLRFGVALRCLGLEDALQMWCSSISSIPGSRRTHIEVTVLPPDEDGYDSAFEELRRRLSAFDLVLIDDPWVPVLSDESSQSHLIDLCSEVSIDEFFPADGTGLYPSLQRAVEWPVGSGQIRGVPIVGNVQMIAHRQDWTPSGPDLTGRDSNAGDFRFFNSNDLVELFWMALRLQGTGEDTATAEGTVRISRHACASAIRELRTLFALGLSDRLERSRAEAVTAGILGADRSSAFSFAWPSWFAGVREPLTPEIEHLRLRSMGEQPLMGAWVLGVPNQSPHKAEAVAAAYSVALCPRFQEVMALRGVVPVLQSPAVRDRLMSEPFWRHNYDAIRAAIEAARPRPRTPLWTDIEQRIGGQIQDLLENRLDELREIPDLLELV